MEAVALNPGRLVAAAVIGLVLLLVLIIKFKVQAMVATVSYTHLTLPTT